MGGPGTPPGKPGFLSINFYEQGNASLLEEFIAFAESKGYEVEQKNNTSVLMGNYNS